jgi:ESS family glutamate:Na+ symporter
MRILQWGLGLLVGLLVLKSIFNVPDGFGLLLAAGFVGGHGTVAAVGTAFEGLGWEEATSLGFTSATVGVVAAILGGLALIKWGTRTQRTTVLTDFADLPEELRTGLIPRQRREPTGQGTISSNSLEPLAFHLGLIFLSALVAYYLSELAERVNPQISVPVFGVAFLVGLIVQGLLVLTGGVSYVDRGTVTGVTGTATDLLVAFSIASIVPSVVADNALPLTILLVFGLFYCLLLFRYLAPIMFSEYAFEKGIFDWGWSTGTVAMGIALLKEYGIAYIPIAPVDVLVTTFAPFLVAFGFAWAFVGASLALGAGVLILAWFLGWWAISPKRPQSS